MEIRGQELHKSFGENPVLTGVNFEVRRGEIVAIVGGSGCGKTVLLDLITGLLQPTSGSILVADHARPGSPLVDLASLEGEALDDIRLHWAVVFQKNALFSGTVLDNIALWLREHTDLSEEQIRTRAVESVRAVSLDENDVLSKDRDALSGGMAKRVAIARAIAVDPLVIFFDEPTTGLDPVVGGHIHELIWTLHHRPVAKPAPDGSKRRTTIIVTHDKELLRRLAPRVIMLSGGSICFDGPYEKFQTTDNAIAREYLQAMPVLHARHHLL